MSVTVGSGVIGITPSVLSHGASLAGAIVPSGIGIGVSVLVGAIVPSGIGIGVSVLVGAIVPSGIGIGVAVTSVIP